MHELAVMVFLSAVVSFLCIGCQDEHVSSFSDAVDVCVGMNHSCAARSNGVITCWGTNTYGEGDVPKRNDFSAVGCSSSYTCGLTTEGEIICWGEKESCIGGDTDDCYDTPALSPPTETGFTQFVMEGNIACALNADGFPFCWGDLTNENATPAPADKQFVQIDGDGAAFCGLESSGEVSCWGFPGYLEAEPDVLENPWDHEPLPDGMLFDYIAVELRYACGIVKGEPSEVYCWGEDKEEQLGPTGYDWNIDNIPAIRIDSTLGFKCILREGKKYKCYGYAGGGALDYPPDDNFIKLALGGDHGCGILKNGCVRCWGDDDYKGQISPP